MEQNPFKPTAGKTPPELIGRDDVLMEFNEALDNGPGAPARLVRVTGIRGMGKTVVLNELGSIAKKRRWTVIDETANGAFTERILTRIAPRTTLKSAAIQPEALGISIGSVEFERTNVELTEAMTRVARHKGLLITLDEVQDAAIPEIRIIAVAVQHLIRQNMDVAFAFAGLPSMVDGVVNSETLTFLRRAVPFELGPLETYEVANSLKATITESGMSIDSRIAEDMAEASSGYPFMVQLIGYYSWQSAARAKSSIITEEAAREGLQTARLRFDKTVIEPALHRLPTEQVRFLLAMAQDSGILSNSSDIASRLGKSTTQISVHRARLIESGIIDAGAWGKLRFAIPYMGEYLREHRDQLSMEIGDRR